MSDATKCEVCGQPAVVSICDFREKPAADGSGYAELEPAGVHHFCEKHERKPRREPTAFATKEQPK